MVGHEVGERLAIEARKVEAATLVFDLGDQVAVDEAQ